MNIQDIKSNTTWQEASNTINNNNNKISLAIATLENAKLKNKGYFTTVEKLKAAIPNPTIGSKAYVGTSEPYAIYIVENGAWVDSGYTGGNEIVAKITTDRIEDGAVTSEKIATSAFDSTLSVSGKIAPADVVGGKLTKLEEKVGEIRQENANKDFSIADDSGYDIVQFNGGNIKTRNFDSKVVIDGLKEYANEIAELNKLVERNTSDIKNTPTIEQAGFDLSFQDDSGYDIVRFYDGHIKTKGFDSSLIPADNVYYEIDTLEKIRKITDDPLAEIRQDAGFTQIFRSWGFIGDSLSSGELVWTYERDKRPEDDNFGIGQQHVEYDGEFTAVIEKVSETQDKVTLKCYADIYKCSWGQHLCRICGAEGYNFSYGGQSAKGWVNDRKPIGASKQNRTLAYAKLNPKDAYVIALGVNVEGTPNGTISDIDLSNKDNNADTFAGNYGKIIQNLKEISNGCVIFVTTIPEDAPNYVEKNSIIKGIANLFDKVYVIDLGNYVSKYHNPEFYAKYYMGGHMTASGYLYRAWEKVTYIDWLIRKNIKDFDLSEIIGYNKIIW